MVPIAPSVRMFWAALTWEGPAGGRDLRYDISKAKGALRCEYRQAGRQADGRAICMESYVTDQYCSGL